MPLKRGRIVGYDALRMAFEFTMVREHEVIFCRISSAAMDGLAGKRGIDFEEREAQFLRLRDDIEKIASDHYDEGTAVAGAVVRIFVKDVVAHSLRQLRLKATNASDVRLT